jgi:hypothetical protein
MPIDPKNLAVDYYFGDLQYWKLPEIAAGALEQGFEGPALIRLASLMNLGTHNLREEDIGASEIDAAFREMGVSAPITRDDARLALAIKSAQRVLSGHSSVFDEATYVRIHLCDLSEAPDSLNKILNLSRETRNAPRTEWDRIEAALTAAFSEFLANQKAHAPE